MAAAYPVPNAADDDDGMPPLVDNPISSMTFTFATDMTPITFSTDHSAFDSAPEPAAAAADGAFYSPPTSPVLGPARGSHAKKRDASYIPRPPNAFILFRSSFIRAQHIPGKIEGNHSALSKIIGKYWKALPREEREVWEAKAVVAQAEHRMRYPDWRFRPGANALAKVKDGPKRRHNKKGRGEAEKEVRSREKRCAKIADLLVAGKTGTDLEDAIKEYDHINIDTAVIAQVSAQVKEEGCVAAVVQQPVEMKGAGVHVEHDNVPQPQHHKEEARVQGAAVPQSPEVKVGRSKTPDPIFDARFKVPLTAMFKRSSSAPAALARNSGQGPPSAHVGRRDSFTAPAPMTIDLFLAPHAPSSSAHEEETRVGYDIETSCDSADANDAGSVFATQSLAGFTCHAHDQQAGAGALPWDKNFNLSSIDTDCTSSPASTFEFDSEGLYSPVQSPLPLSFGASVEHIAPGAGWGFVEYPYSPVQSSYSSLTDWAGETFAEPASPISLPYIGSHFVYGPDAVGSMQTAFEAAASAIYGDWHGGYDGQGYLPNRWDSSAPLEGLQHYSEGLQDILHRQDNHQLFDRVGFSIEKRGRFTQF